MSRSSSSVRAMPPPGRGSLGRYLAVVLLGSIPVLVLAVFAYLVSARSVELLINRGNDAAAVMTAALVEREFEHWTATLTSHAGFPTFSTAVTGGDVEAVRQRLEIFVTAHPWIDRAFVTDPTGLLWADFPVATESLGRRFDDRDWFRGVSRAGTAYVSEVYRRNAAPQVLVVAVATPVRSPSTGALSGFMVAQIRLDDLSGLLRRVEVGEAGIVLLGDHTGALAAHPALDLETRRADEYSDVRLPSVGEPAPPRESRDRGDSAESAESSRISRGHYTDPVTGHAVLASSLPARVGDHDWTVVAQQPVEAAFAPIRGLARRLGGAGVLMGGLVAVLLWGVVRENARRREAEAGLVAMNEELERRVEERTAALEEKEEQLLHAQKMEAVGRLAGGVAHDFNNLLTVILGAADHLLSGLSSRAAEREDLEQVRLAAERGANLTHQLLAFSRKQVMKAEVLDVNESVTRMRGILERVLGERIGLVFKLAPRLHPVKFDPGQIEQVIMNLAVNARDAMPDGGRLTIETANVELDEDYVEDHVDARPGAHVMLAVTDTGTGMDAETRKRIFEPFFTTKRLGRGTGLGLSTVYGIVRQGGGNIWVYSEPGRGSTFKVYLPRTEDVPQAAEKPTPLPVEGRGTGTILVVEDEDAVRSLLVRVLTRAGYEVLDAPDAATAASVFRSREGGVDLLLSDVVLPDTSGPDLAKGLQEEQEGLKVLFMSGYTDESVVEHGLLDELAAFIEKPFRTRALVDRVRQELSRS